MKERFPSCPACGSPLKAHNDEDADLLEGWDFECGGGLYKTKRGNVRVNFECQGTKPLEAAMKKMRTAAVSANG